jgi:hypothetical protein
VTHPTDPELISLLQGQPEAPDLDGHLAACDDCRERSTQLSADLSAVRFHAGFRETRQRLAARAASRSRRRWWSVGGVGLVAAAASVALLVQPVSPSGVRTKGGPVVRLVRGAGKTGPLQVGERVSLGLQPGRHRYALLLSVDTNGAVEQVWPATETQSGHLADAPEIVLQSGFDITPGSFILHAFLSDAPLPAADAAEALRRHRTNAGNLALIPGEEAHATVDVVVAPER